MPDMLWSMKFLDFKNDVDISDTSYKELYIILQEEDCIIESLHVSRRYLQEQFGLNVQNYDCCIKDCMTFTERHKAHRKYAHCDQLRFVEPKDTFEDDIIFYPDFQSYEALKPRAVFIYIPLIPRLKLLYANTTMTTKMRYPSSLKPQHRTAEDIDESNSNPEGWQGIRDI